MHQALPVLRPKGKKREYCTHPSADTGLRLRLKLSTSEYTPFLTQMIATEASRAGAHMSMDVLHYIGDARQYSVTIQI